MLDNQAKRDHLEGVRQQILEALADALAKIERGAPPRGKYWMPNTWAYLNRWKKHCESALEVIDAEIAALNAWRLH